MQVVLGPNPFHIVYAGTQGQNKGSIVNFDNANTILVGPEQGALYAANPECFQIGPLNSVTVDGSRDYYGIALTGTAAVEFMPGVTNWSPSPAQAAIQIATLGLATEATQQLVEGNTGDTVTGLGTVNGTLGSPAQDGSVQAVHTVLGSPAQDGSVTGLGTIVPGNIALTGAPLLALANVFSNPGGQTFTAGQTRVYGSPSPFPQISYEIFIFLSSNASETNPEFQVELDWFNSASGQTVSVERWFLAGGASPGGNSYVGTGRAKGDTLQVSIKNLGTLTSGNCQVVIMKSSRIYTKDDFRSTFFAAPPGFVGSTYDTDANVLMATASNVGATSNIVRPLAMYAGTVRISAFTQTAAASISITTMDASLSNNTVFTVNIGANAFVNQQFDLPRKCCIATIQNQGAATQQIGCCVYISEQNI